MRSRFDQQLALLNRELTLMGALCEDILSKVSQSMVDWDPDLKKNIQPVAQEIDQKERDIEALCLKLILHQQPVARDLRVISAALKIITDMERIGDQAEDIAEIITYLGGRTGDTHTQIQKMARAAIGMVVDSVDAYVRKDLALAEKAIQEDDVVDNYFAAIKKDLIGWIAQQPQDGEYALDLLMIAKYLERIGDHATNIAEWVIFSITGKHEEESV
ncbi:MAG TPA: phosphate signaling complex protein PhoU [Candidatus Faecousia excrementipullorum]|jgi:phosphate transport system protein|nr:phosphate signaling complex protein PhoU [Candidatus Faecousia excrementipullorum]